MRNVGIGLTFGIALHAALGCSSSSSSAGASGATCGTSSCTNLSPVTGARYVAVDATAVYFTHGDGVTRIGLADGKVTPLVTGVDADHIALDDGNVYYSLDADHVNSQIFAVPKTGGQPTLLASGQLTPYALLVADGALFWTTFGSYGATKADGTMMRMDLGTKTITTVQGNLNRGGLGIVATGGNVYFTSCGTLTPGMDGALWKASTAAGSKATAIVSGLKCPEHLGADATGLYVTVQSTPTGTPTGDGTESTGTDIDQAAQFAPPLTTIQKFPEDVFGFATDASGIVVAKGTGEIVEFRGGQETVLLTMGKGEPEGLALDAENVYALSSHTGLWRVARH